MHSDMLESAVDEFLGTQRGEGLVPALEILPPAPCPFRTGMKITYFAPGATARTGICTSLYFRQKSVKGEL